MLTGHDMSQVAYEDKDKGVTASAVDCYFMCQDGSMFKARMHFSPYFYLQVKVGWWEFLVSSYHWQQ